MKLNPDCIRDILLLAEENTDLITFLSINPDAIPDELSSYSPNEIMYHIKQCEESGFFHEVSWFLDGGCLILYLSPYGHQFLSDIREDNNWTKTKEIAKNVGSSSLDSLKQIATGVIAALIQKQFDL